MATATSNTWPRVISRGPLKGRSFKSANAYMQALNEVKDAPGSKNGKAVPGDDYYFELIVVRGRMKLEVTGDPRSSADIDALLEVLGTFGTEA